MSLKFERILAFGPVVDYPRKETWTQEVKDLYQRLKDGDCTALAPLLAIDLEFIRDTQALRALLLLKYDPDYPAASARRELRKIANVLTRRPSKRGTLPTGDFLQAELRGLSIWLRAHGLLAYKKDPDDLRKRLRKLLARSEGRETLPDGVLQVDVGWENADGEVVWRPDPRPEPLSKKDKADIEAICDALVEGVRPFGRYVRSTRSWALNALSIIHDTDRKMIEKRISRDPLVRQTKTLPRKTRTKR